MSLVAEALLDGDSPSPDGPPTAIIMHLRLLLTAGFVITLSQPNEAAETAVQPAGEMNVGGVSAAEILSRLGAKMERGTTADQLKAYSRVFGFVDANGDGKHSKSEFIDNGTYLTPQARRGIFNAADSDQDGFVTEAEYVFNRIITDEAKELVQAMDDDGDGVVQRAEFLKHAGEKLADAKLAKDVFAAFDADGNQEIIVPEYLRVWGRWARSGAKTPEQRLAAAPKLGDADFPMPAPSERHAQKVSAVKKGDYDLALIGDSITHTIGELGGKYAPMKPVWDQWYAPHNAINLGHNGYRTEQILWCLQNGELEFARSPQVVMLLIGTNNTDDRHFKTVHTVEEVFAGTKAIVDLIKQRHPTTKILVLRIFPRGGDDEKGVSPPPFNSSQQCIETCRRAGELTRRLADGKQVFWLDLNQVFLEPNGAINTELMWDLLHPSPAGAAAWAKAVEPSLSRLLSGKPLPAVQTLAGADAPARGEGTSAQRGVER